MGEDEMSAAIDSAPVRVGPYSLSPLTSVRQDDIRAMLGSKPGVYVCNLPEEAWYERFGGQRRHNFSIEKKLEMFTRLAPGSYWISPTFDWNVRMDTDDWQHGCVLHLGHGRLRGRAAQTLQTLKAARWLAENRGRYAYSLVYNFDLPQYLPPLAAKACLGKRLYVDYEDNYTTASSSAAKRLAEHLGRRAVDGAICVHEGMTALFPLGRSCVSNCFADFAYTSRVDFRLRDGMRFLYSGRLDSIRGVDLIPELISALRLRIRDFTIRVTGDGPHRALVESWWLPELEYVGFLDDQSYHEELERADACLVLQRPDHPFSQGSFPSKIDAYARHKKPIFVLTLETMAR
jgi:glycosyltransferase involved in cell wall biosynthesis